MTQAHKTDAIDSLSRTPASDVKRLGWRGVMKAVGSKGKIVVTNHNEPEAVILSIAEYTALANAQTTPDDAQALEVLRRRFDERLSALHTDDASDRLRALIRSPAKLQGKLKAGSDC
ncbi:type II toxin-antitoxin system prevent-host-death family antitoxin [Pseudothauera lacus]|uniref:Prevent-host-death protein n=1 Tax=Pseudothauera lacus TaxID=2136175 RepID=A0A2T4IIU8_9RHOO|nr:type II toxin-antitoxin system prevent-host-death family antitoxin [Pseudothauera lacus]PTD97691.1 prevent-host-death protein [Pseudothauera lacus]